MWSGVRCRLAYDLDYSSDIAGILKLPPELLYYVDEPQRHLPDKLPEHDVMIAINVHEDILLALPERAKEAGAKAMIIPREHPDWLSNWAWMRIQKGCQALGLECASPKPFCSLKGSRAHSHINQFMRHYKIGEPKFKIEVNRGIIKDVEVLRSAPCGNTYFVAHNIVGKKVDEGLDQWVAKYWHSYPCIASMQMDSSLKDTVLHKGGYIHLGAVRKAVKEAIARV